jgi:L-alanine-DL-glutamate epimerase-like enolase superfamily enzyme
VKLGIERVTTRLRTPFVSSTGSVSSRDLLLVSLVGDDGVTGYGEAAPLESYDGVDAEACHAALEDCRHELVDVADRSEALGVCRRLAVLPQAVAAIDLALWDLEGRRTAMPVWRLLGADTAPDAEVNATIAAADRAGASQEAARARAAGFGCVKLKVGLGDDAGRLAAVRAAAGPAMAIRLDANGAWSVEEALASLRAFEPAGIELCEEPVSGLVAIAAVAAGAPVPIALDESARLPGALDRRYADAVCLKVSGCGGISGVIDAATRARACGYEVYLASTLDGPLGIAAAVHAAAVVRPDRWCGLATLGAFAGRPLALGPAHGRLCAPAGPGLGVDPSWYR